MNIAEEILKERYYQPGEDWPKLCRRVAYAVAQGDAGKGMEEEFYDCLVNKKFLPNSPTLMNAGIDGTLSACFTVDVEDNMESIFDTVKDMAIIGKFAGGVGCNWSNIRPNGSRVGSTNGVASGPVSFLYNVDAMAESVKQGGKRRMAVMSILDVGHPDIKEFITVKDDLNKLKNMNMSVMITDEFMNKVESNDKESLDIWNLIIEHAWKNSEPGVLFYDRINQDNFTPQIPIVSTNPCVSADTVILTDSGYVRIDSVENKSINVWNGYEWSNVTPHVTGYNQNLMSITFSDGSELKCTPYHKFVLKNGNRVEAHDLHIGQKLIRYNFPIIEGVLEENEKLMYTKGFYSGDGYFTKREKLAYIDLYDIKCELINYLEFIHIYKHSKRNRITLRLDKNINFDKEFVPSVEYTIKSRLNWLAGLVDSDGSISPTGQINISSTNKKFLLNVKFMLNTLGINVKVSKSHKAGYRDLPDQNGGLKSYYCVDSYNLCIPRVYLIKLIEYGFKTHRIDLNINDLQIDRTRLISIRSIKLLDEKADKVYCFNEPKNHTGCFNGIVTAQCAEEPMIPYSSCNLISINLSKLVNNGTFNWEEFRYLIRTAIKFADSTIDVNTFPLKKIEEVTRGLRPIGLSVLGFAHCLIKLGIVYGSQESYDFAKSLFNVMNAQSIDTSIQLGKEFGVFPWFDKTNIETPRRNCYVNSIAPTGTVATLCDLASFGIECLFTIVYERKVLNQTFQVFDPVFEEMITSAGLDKDKIFNLVKGKSSIQNIEEIPENIRKLFITAHDLTPLQHVQMVATIQPYIDTGISKTVNAPADITIQEVDELYRYAWKNGCKGITIYRAGSRDAPIKLEEERPTINKEYFAPDKTIGNTNRITTACGHFHCTVSGIDDTPLKVFNNPTTGGCKANLEAIGRLSSLCLRSGISPELVIKQLSKVKCDACLQSEKAMCKSCADGVAQTIKDYVPIKIDINSNEIKEQNTKIKCSSCGKEFEPNTKCSVCPHCGFSRCG